MNAFLLEERLLSLDTVDDCRVVARRTAGESGQGSGQGSGSERLVGYVVPATSVRPERIGEWIRSLQKHCSEPESSTDPATPCDLVALSRLPLTSEGQIDTDLLAIQPVLNDQLARRWEDRLRGLAGIEDAMVTVELDHQPLPHIHSSELFSEPIEPENSPGSPRAISQPAKQIEPPSNRASAQSLSISHGGAIKGPDELPRLLGETLKHSAERHPDHGLRILLNRSELFFSYPELLDRAHRVLGGLQRAGLRPGDRVIFQFIENQDFLIAFWACILGGIVPAPLSPSRPSMSAPATRLGHAWRILDASMVLSSRELVPHINELLGKLNLPEARLECVEDLSQSDAGELHMGDGEDLALIMLTSGSTGVPKAVMLSHRNLIRRSAGSAQMNGFSSDAVTLNWMPLDHVAGIVYFHLRDVFLGCQQIHAATDLVTQDPLIWPEWVDRYRVTTTFAPNFAFGLVNDHSDEIAARARTPGGVWDLSCLRYLLNGAEAIVPRTARRFLEILAPYGLPPTAMWPVWGMSETSSGTIYSDAFGLESSSDEDPFVEVGRPIPGFSVRIVDDKEQPAAEGTAGSLQVKGDQVTTGYYRRPDLNAESFTEDGWFRTGDLGFLLRGRLTITGREKDVIVINSVNYPCHEIEGLVEEIDGIETSFTAACAVRDADAKTDRLAIFFHPAAGCETVSAELIRTIRGAVSRRLGVSPDYLLPVEREAIPKTNIGKIQRPELARSFAQGDFLEVLRRVEVLTGGANTLPDWFFQPVWQRADLRGRRESGPVLILADSRGLGAYLGQTIVAGGGQCILVFQAREFAEEADRLSIDPVNSDHYKRALEVLNRRGFEPHSIVHLWTYGEDPAHPEGVEETRDAQETGVLSVLRLAQALNSAVPLPAGGLAVRLTVVSNRLQSVEDGTNPRENQAQAFEKASLLGLLKTIPQENPALACCHLDLRLAANEENAPLILSELGGRTRDLEVAYRHGRRWVRRLERADLRAQPRGPLPIENGGLYLLSGGLGGIGLELAKYLLKHFQASLILVGRTKVGRTKLDAGDRQASLNSLEVLASVTKGNVLYAATDVGDSQRLSEIVGQAEKRFSRALAGVFHLAGLFHQSTVAEETAAGMRRILDPKLKGALALHQLIERRPGALFVSFSSVNGFMGGYGVSAYAAANSLLEAFSEFQRRSTLVKAYCVSFSLWDGVGMSRGYVLKDAARERGFYAISARQGLSSLLAVLERPPGHRLVGLDGSNFDVRRLSRDLSLPAQSLAAWVSGDSPRIAELSLRQSALQISIQDRFGTPAFCRLKKAPPALINTAGEIDRNKGFLLSTAGVQAAGGNVPPADDLERTIAAIWRAVLRVEQLGVTDNFFDLGGSSLAMGQANGRLQETLKRTISMTETFQYSTVRTLAAYLSGSKQTGTAPELDNSKSRGERRRERVRGRRRES
jgi:acyl-CoA synthetase (AMP-forming)/AMP-acid ligase II/NAD(P)-dependent dehydrogenase (short-subunit alcohol dehydrogenase family)/acyl carrier protein